MTNDFSGMFNETVLFEQLLKNEPVEIAQIVADSLKSSNEPLLNINTNVTVSIFDDIDTFCIYVYLQDYVEKAKIKTDFSNVQFLDLKSPTENGAYYVILRITKKSSLSEMRSLISICICYIKNEHTSIRSLQYKYKTNVLKESNI